MLGLSAGAVDAAVESCGQPRALSAPEAWQVGFLPCAAEAGSAVERSFSV